MKVKKVFTTGELVWRNMTSCCSKKRDFGSGSGSTYFDRKREAILRSETRTPFACDGIFRYEVSFLSFCIFHFPHYPVGWMSVNNRSRGLLFFFFYERYRTVYGMGVECKLQ